MTLRSANWVTYLAKLVFVAILGMVVSARLAPRLGFTAFSFRTAEDARALFVLLLVLAFAAWAMRVRGRRRGRRLTGMPSKEPLATAEATVPIVGEKADASPPAPEPVSEPAQPVEEPAVAAKADDARAPDGEAVRLWEQARSMGHNFVPRLATDYEYLRLVYEAAMAGHAEAMAKLGEYATRRGKLVESYYWMKRASYHGVAGLARPLRSCRSQWVRFGCPPEAENEHPFFSPRQGALGRAALRLDSGMGASLARSRLKAMVAEGDEEAALFMRRGTA